MSGRGLSRRERRVIIVSVAVLAVAVIAIRVVPAVRTWQQVAERRAASRVRQAAEAETLVRYLPAAADTLAARRKRLTALDTALIPGRTRAAAAAALTAQVSDAAARADVRVDALDLESDTVETGAFTRVRARLNATGDIRGLGTLLVALERAPSMLVVRELAISQPDPSPQLEMPENLGIELVVEALARADTTARMQ